MDIHGCAWMRFAVYKVSHNGSFAGFVCFHTRMRIFERTEVPTGGTLPYSYFWTPAECKMTLLPIFLRDLIPVRVTDTWLKRLSTLSSAILAVHPSHLADSNPVPLFRRTKWFGYCFQLSRNVSFTYQWSPGGTDSIASSLLRFLFGNCCRCE